MSENISKEENEVKKETTKKSATTKTTKPRKKTAQVKSENNRFADVIGKMEEETIKLQETKAKPRVKKEATKLQETKAKPKVKKETEKTTNKVKKESVKTDKKEVKKTKSSSNEKITKSEKEPKKIKKQKEIKEEKVTEDKPKKSVAMTKSKKTKDLITDEKKLKKIEEELKQKTKIPEEKMRKIYSRIVENIACAIAFLVYYILIMIGYKNIDANIFITDLKVFSMATIITTVCIFEYSYKKDNGKNAILGMEFLVLSITTLLSLRLYIIYNAKFTSAVASVALLFALYYVVKSTIIYIREKKKAQKETIDSKNDETEI